MAMRVLARRRFLPFVLRLHQINQAAGASRTSLPLRVVRDEVAAETFATA